jgi:hypothetical protein
MAKGNGLHIQLWDVNKALDIGNALGAPNKFMNDFFGAVDSDSFILSMQQLMREKHVHLKIVVEKVNINQTKKDN